MTRVPGMLVGFSLFPGGKAVPTFPDSASTRAVGSTPGHLPVLATFPRTLIPLVVFNVVGFGLGGDPWSGLVLAVAMPSGVMWSMTLGDIVIAIALIVLFLDVLRAVRDPPGFAYHAAGVVVLAVYVAEFLAIGAAATSVFLTLTLIALVDTGLAALAPRRRGRHGAEPASGAKPDAGTEPAADGSASDGSGERNRDDRPIDGEGPRA